VPEWFVEPLKRLEDPGVRRMAVPVLARIESPGALAVVAAWADDPDAALATAARTALNKIRAEEERSERQYADLLAGRIQPDDLLPPAQPYVWNGEDYVPEGQPAEAEAERPPDSHP
jgi:hypothetical protein